CGDLLLHTSDKVRRRFQIERNDNYAAQQATVKARDPLRTVLAPEEHAIASDNVSRLELTRELKRRRSKPPVGPARKPHSHLVRHGSLLAMRTTVVEKAKQRLPHQHRD